MAFTPTSFANSLQSKVLDLYELARSAPVTTVLIAVPTAYIVISNMSRLLGHARIAYHHADHTLSMPLHSGSTTTLAALIKPLVPSCFLNPFLFNGDLQTVATLFKRRHIGIHYKRHIFEADDPTYTGQFAVDFVTTPSPPPPLAANNQDGTAAAERDDDEDDDHDRSLLPPRTTYFTDPQWQHMEQGSSDSRPMLVVLHGLSGGSHELYLRAFLEPLVASSSETKKKTNSPEGSGGGGGRGGGGWEACVVISRGCSQTKLTSSILYNGRATWDIRQTVRWLREKFPNRPLFGVGFSLGGNILVNYLGEEGERCELKAAVVFSAVWNMEVGANHLQRGWWNREIYNRALGGNMKRLFETHVDQIRKNPAIDVDKVRKIRYLYEFDRYVQGPSWGYATEGAYYRDASSIDACMAVRVPLLAFHALDDPVVCDEVLPFEEVKVTPYVVLCTTSLGGHLGWFENGGGRWFVKPSTAFLQKMVDEVQLNELSRTEAGAMQGRLERDQRAPLRPLFDPTRRKLHIPAH